MIKGLVSVIIPSYNRGHILSRAVDSVLNQTYSLLEIIIIDDGSKDNTREVVEQKYGDNPKIRYLHQDNGGVSSARNRGMRMAQGEFIAFLDSDDFWFKDKIHWQVSCFEKCPEVGMIWTEFCACASSGKTLHEKYLRKMYDAYRFFPNPMDLFSEQFRLKELLDNPLDGVEDDIYYYTGSIYSAMIFGNLVHTSTVIFRQDLLEKIGFFDEAFRVGEDYKFHLKTTSLTKAGFIDHPLIAYQIMETDALTNGSNHLQLAENFLQTFKESLQSESIKKELPRSRVNICLADTYNWIGGEHAKLTHYTTALRYFIKSILLRPTQLEAYKNTIKLVLVALGLG